MTRGIPTKALTLLTAAVVAAHLAVLQAGTLALPTPAPAESPPARAFVTRTVVSPPAPAPAENATSAAPAAATPSVARPRRQAQAQAQAQTEAHAEPMAALVEPEMPFTASAEVALVEPSAPPPEVAVLATPVVTAAVDVALADAPPAPAPELTAPPPPPPLSAATVPGTTLLRYEVASNKLPFTVNGVFRWQQTGSTYEAQLSYSAFGFSRRQTSQGAVSATGLAPDRFADKLRNEVAAHFNYPAQKITFSANTPDAALLSGAQDRLSVLVQLGAQMAAAPERYPEGTTLSFQTVGPRDAAMWLFTVQGPETLALPGGELPSVKLVRNPRQEYDQKVELWLAPALGYLPARIRITEQNGDTIDQQWLATE